MCWKEKGAGIILALRALVFTKGRFDQFWDRIYQAGLRPFLKEFKLIKTIFFNRLANVTHQILIIMQIMNGIQTRT